jgi:hypothetical protein
MNFEVISEIREIEIIAVGRKIRELARLRRKNGPGRWRKLKGVAKVRLRSGRIRWRNYIGMKRMELAASK